MRAFTQHADSGDENDSERDDLCPSCGEYLERYHGDLRYACGDCRGGNPDYFPVTVSELCERAYEQKHGRL